MTTRRFGTRVATTLITQNPGNIAVSNFPIGLKVGDVANELGFGSPTQEADTDFVASIVESSPDARQDMLERLGLRTDLAQVLFGIFEIEGLLLGILQEVYKPLWK